jgi:hypothetical protein
MCKTFKVNNGNVENINWKEIRYVFTHRKR